MVLRIPANLLRVPGSKPWSARFNSRLIFTRPPTPSRNHKVEWPEEPLDLPAAQRGGFFAASPGIVLNSRYSIVRKLGWGQHSSVWLARDNEFVSLSPTAIREVANCEILVSKAMSL